MSSRHSISQLPPSLQVVCKRSEVLASACAIARSFPIYNEKSGAKTPEKVEVGFIIVGEDTTLLNKEDVECLNAICEGVRLAQEIVDTPTNIMHTDGFLEVRGSVKFTIKL